MTLAEFKTVVQPSYDARKKISDGEEMVSDGINERDDSDEISNGQLLLVVNGVKGDPTQGENSDRRLSSHRPGPAKIASKQSREIAFRKSARRSVA